MLLTAKISADKTAIEKTMTTGYMQQIQPHLFMLPTWRAHLRIDQREYYDNFYLKGLLILRTEMGKVIVPLDIPNHTDVFFALNSGHDNS